MKEQYQNGYIKGKGHLKGYSSRGKLREIVDFRPQIGVYVLFTENREVIYVGQVGVSEKRTLFGRLRRHKRDHLRGRWSHFSWFGLKDVDLNTRELKSFEKTANEGPGDVLNEIEAILIHLLEPRLNLQRGRWNITREYFQCIEGETYSASEEEEDEDE